MSYSFPLQRLLKLVMNETSAEERLMWHFIYDHTNGPALLKGKYAEFIRDCPSEIIAWIVEIYEKHIIKMRYSNIDDALSGTDLPVCPMTGLGIKPLDLSVSTIDALETTWEQYVNTPHEESKNIRNFSIMMCRLLRITLHLQWAGFAGFMVFDQKWNQLKHWGCGQPLRSQSYIDPLAVSAMKNFINPPSWDDYAVFPRILPLDMRRWLYKEIEELYTSSMLDPTIWDEQRQREMLGELTDIVLADESVDDLFKDQFRQ